jgi:AhpD family alkylhydroperoxidase
MNARFNYAKVAPGTYEAMDALEQYLLTCGLDKSLRLLIQLRASQINGCAYCLDMHWKDLRAIGECEQRLYSLDAWRECPYYSERERAALAGTEAVTLVANGHVPDALFQEVREHFNERELSDLTFAVATINAWTPCPSPPVSCRARISQRRRPPRPELARMASMSSWKWWRRKEMT